ncbi:DUF3631 domain-containing protein [Pseudolysinimonas sp.]
MTPTDDSTVQTVPDGSILSSVLDDVRRWFSSYILVTDDLDLDLLTLWAAHTYVALETYSTPRLIVDSTMYGSGKTTVIEHLQRLCHRPVQAASLSSPALLARMLDKEVRTILIDEVDRSLDPKKPGVEELIAILNSGYKRGATRPVLVPAKGGTWDVAEMPTYSPVAMAGNAPNLPDDTRSRSIRVLLMPDLYGTVSATDWEEIEPDAIDLAENLGNAMDEARDAVRVIRPELPERCVGRVKEKWSPLARVAAVAGGKWPTRATELIARDIRDLDLDREEGLTNRPPAVVLLADMHAVWPESEPFVSTSNLIGRLIEFNGDYWGSMSAYGKALTAQRMGRMIVQSSKIHSSKNASDVRGYERRRFTKPWRQLGITFDSEPSETVGTVEPSAEEAELARAWALQNPVSSKCRRCGEQMTVLHYGQEFHPGCEVAA